MRHIPNLITSMNLICGFFAIIFASNGDLVTASWMIFAAMIFDFLDGFSARLLKAYSEIGKELDSLADVVSFGVAPGFIIYLILKDSVATAAPFIVNSESLKTAIFLILPAVMPVCGALRLAIFNIDTTQSTSFKGLPIPANALGVISIVLSAHYSQSPLLNSFLSSPVILIIYTFCLSLLMVTRIPLLSLKITNLKFAGNEGRYILVGLVVIIFAIFGITAAPLIIPAYIIASLLSLVF